MRAMTGTGNRRNASQQRCTRVMNRRALGAIEAGDFGNVGAADKGAAAGAGKDRQPQFRVGRDPAHLLDDLGHQRAVEAVELGPVVDRQMRDMAALAAASSRRTRKPPHARSASLPGFPAGG